MKNSSIEKMEFEVIVFDTAPTGHTLRFLNFPNILEKGLSKLLTLKEKFSNILSSMGGVLGSEDQVDQSINNIFTKMEKMKDISTKVNSQMKNQVIIFFYRKAKTTFIAVCIPEFLSMYETERLIQ